MSTAMWSRVLSTESNTQVPGCSKQWTQQTLTKQDYFGALQTSGFHNFHKPKIIPHYLITGNSNVNLLHKTMKCMSTWL